MELKELSLKTLEIFNVENVENLGNAIMDSIEKNDNSKMQEFYNLVDGDLSKDWLQMIYQYYCADRSEKKQDYTPKCLAQFLSRLIGESTETIDMCAGSGALTIQRWVENPDMVFILHEIDENVIPYLLFNMAIRNINATVNQSDILQNEIARSWVVRKGEKFGKVTCVKSSI